MKFFISIVLTLLFAVSVFAQTRRAEVIVPTTYLRKSPSSVAEKVFTLQSGASLNLENEQNKNGWRYVSTADRKVKGWINENTIRLTEQEAQAAAQAPQTTVSTPPLPAPTPTAVAEPAASSAPAPVVVTERSPAPQAENPVVATVRPRSAPEPSPVPEASPAVEEDKEVLRIETEEINLNVRVIDANNRPIQNLNQSHFRIYEDNVLQPITGFTIAEVPVNYALVVDNSRSLRSQLGKVIEAGKIIVGTNRPKDESTVVRFVSADKIEVVQDFTSNKSSINNALDNLFVEGGQTAIIDAVYLTAKRLEQYEKSHNKADIKRRALILISDGEDRASSYSEQQLFELIRKSDVQIYAVGLINNLSNAPGSGKENRHEKAKAFLTRLAEETGGKAYFLNTIDELPQIASDISGELRRQYLISYAPTNQERNGTFRNIKVDIAESANKEKRIAITRTGRIPAPK